MAESPFVLFRADASPTTGLGHAMRSRTLAIAFTEVGCRVRLAGRGLHALPRDPTGKIKIQNREEDANGIADAEAIAEAAPDLAVVDGYAFSAEFFTTLEACGIQYAIIDDNVETMARRPVAVLNQNPHASPDLYKRLAGRSQLLLGLDYAMIRPELVTVAQNPPERVHDHVFIAMGGSDPRQLTEPVTEIALRSGRQVFVALGPAVTDRLAVAGRLTGLGATILDADDYERRLASSGIAILAAGSSLWEAAAVGTPTIAVIVAKNQRNLGEAAERLGLAITAIDAESGDLLLIYRERIHQMLDRTRRFATAPLKVPLDGAHRAASRLVRIMTDGRRVDLD